MAAEIVVKQGEKAYPMDRDEKTGEGQETLDDDAFEDATAKKTPKPKSAADRMVDKGALQRSAVKRKFSDKDPYEGHGAKKDELQENWEKAIKAVRKHDMETRHVLKNHRVLSDQFFFNLNTVSKS